LAGFGYAVHSVRKMSLRSPLSRRTYAVWQNWSLDRHQRSMHVLRNQLPTIRAVGGRYRSPGAENMNPFQQIEAIGSRLIATFCNKIGTSCQFAHRNGTAAIEGRADLTRTSRNRRG
jgi:hypothetical protein